jgi:hypothetical protein
MSITSSARFGSWFQAWCGLGVGVCLILPVLLRLEEEGWTGANIFFGIAGTVLTIFWVTRLVLLGWIKRREASTETEGRGSH